MSNAKQTAIGVSLASIVIVAWLAVHIGSVFWLSLSMATIFLIIPIIVLQTWLSAGLFIVAHDAMHGSLAPGSPRLNRGLGSLALGVYAFFPYRSVAKKHHAHHRFSGHKGDPDFFAEGPLTFWPWYRSFMGEYFSIKQLAAIVVTVLIYSLIFHASIANILLFWAFPALLSSLQLFTFGTWLPHRHDDRAFCDRHNARSLEYGWLRSLAACYHFGYHVEHHRAPHAPWWALPRVRAQRLAVDRTFEKRQST